MFERIKKIITIIGLSMVLVIAPLGVSFAGQKNLEFAWEQSAADLEQLSKWTLYYGTTSGGNYIYNVAIPYDGVSIIHTNIQQIVAPDNMETTYYFILTATDKDGNESGPSNEVSYMFDFEAPSAPFSVIITVVSE